MVRKCLPAALALVFLAGLAACRRQEPPAQEVGPADYGRVMTRTMRTAREMDALLPLRQALDAFHAVEGRYPRDLSELQAGNYYPTRPEPPAGKRFRYNPADGSLVLEPVP